MPEVSGQAGNLFILVPNLALPLYTSSVSAFSQQTGYGPANLQIQRTDSQWRSANWTAPTPWFEFVFDQVRTFNAVAMVAGRFPGVDTSLVTWQAELADNAAYTDKLTVGPQPWVVGDSGAALDRDDLLSWNLGPATEDLVVLEAASRLHTAALFRNTPKAADRLRVTISRGDSPVGTSYAEVAALFAGFGWQTEINFEWGASFETIETRDRVHRVFDCNFVHTHDADVFVRLLRKYWLRYGTRGRVFAWFYPEKPAFFYEQAGMFSLAEFAGPGVDGLWDGQTDQNSLRLRFVETWGSLPSST